MPLEQVVEDHISIAKIVEKIPQPKPPRLGNDLGVNVGSGLEQNLIQPVIHLVEKPIALLKRIGILGVLRASAAQK